MITNAHIDGGNPFDWGKTSEDYAKFRDIYPQAFYDKILARGYCTAGQTVLDIGTGTGVLPRNLYRYGAKWIAADISANQIAQAKRLSEGMQIDYRVSATEDLNFPNRSFDVITACQCFHYFDHARVAENFARMLKPNGRLLVLFMEWLPFEDEIAAASEKLVLKYNPSWSGAGETVAPISVPDCYSAYFDFVSNEEYPLLAPFTRESWHGRIRSCRGIGASLSEAQIASWEEEHKALLTKIAPEAFEIAHYGAIAELRKKV